VARSERGRRVPEFYFYGELARAIAAHRTIFVVPPLIEWNVPLFQRPQQMALALAKQGALVVFFSEAQRYDAFDGFVELRENLFLVSDFSHFDRFAEVAWITNYSTIVYGIEEVRRWKRLGARVLYEYIDHIDEEVSPGYSEQCLEIYHRLADVDYNVLLASSDLLYDGLRTRFSPARLAKIPNGVDAEHFRSRDAQAAVPEKLRPIADRQKLVVGYFGAMARWLDYDAINEIVRSNQDLEFVFIGWDYDGSAAKLAAADNLIYLGVIPYRDLPRYSQFFDVAIIPFKPGKIAKATSPLKLFEYLAQETPTVVCSDMVECVRHSGVFAADSADAYGAAIRRAAGWGKSRHNRRTLRRIAVENSWESRAEALLKAIAQYDQEQMPGNGIYGGWHPPRQTEIDVVAVRTRSGTVGRVVGCQVDYGATGVALRYSATPKRGDVIEVECRVPGLIGTPESGWARLEIDLGVPYQATMAEQFLKIVYDVQIGPDLYFTEDVGQPNQRNLIVLHRLVDELPRTVLFRIRALQDCEEGWGWHEAATLVITGLSTTAGDPAFGNFGVSSNLTCQKEIISAAASTWEVKPVADPGAGVAPPAPNQAPDSVSEEPRLPTEMAEAS